MTQKNYGIEDIESLDFRTGVRTRIQMYLGSDDNEGTYQALKEIINNSTDEALAGYGKKIKISISEKENWASVIDYGRGVPFGIREDGENVLVSIYSKSHTGGKFKEGAYKNASGLNGIGAKCVCLSSEKCEIQSVRDGKAAMAYFEKVRKLPSFKPEQFSMHLLIDPYRASVTVEEMGKIARRSHAICLKRTKKHKSKIIKCKIH